MPRAIIGKPVLDTLIRAKVANVRDCAGVEPMPVAWKDRDPDGCNWTIPGWAGEVNTVGRCVEEMQQYLRFLRSQFNIPDENGGGNGNGKGNGNNGARLRNVNGNGNGNGK